jgi:hypothetical protein
LGSCLPQLFGGGNRSGRTVQAGSFSFFTEHGPDDEGFYQSP